VRYINILLHYVTLQYNVAPYNSLTATDDNDMPRRPITDI